VTQEEALRIARRVAARDAELLKRLAAWRALSDEEKTARRKAAAAASAKIKDPSDTELWS
jgi:hypothetical protein